MSLQNNLCIGNYALLKSKEIIKIRALYPNLVSFTNSEGMKALIYYDNIEPLPITEDLLNKSKAKRIAEKRYDLHIEFSYEINIDNKFYYIRGFKYKSETIWSIGSFNIKYFHSLQNYLKFINNDFELVLF